MREGDEKTHYATLDVATDASVEDVRRAARRLMQTHHPDRGGDPAVAAQINLALAVLTDPQRREDYDRELQGEPTEAGGPDPDTYEDSWGTESAWDEPAQAAPEEELDVEVEDDQASPGTPPTDPAGTGPAEPSPSETPPEPKPTRVRTTRGQALLLGLVPSLVLLLYVVAETHIARVATPWLFPAVGLAAAIVALVLLRRRLPRWPGPRSAAATMLVAAFVVIALTWLAGDYLPAVAAAQALVAAGPGLALTWKGLSEHRVNEVIVGSKALSRDGTIFGQSSGDTAGEMLNATIWSMLAAPSMRAGRGFQTADPENLFTKAVLLGDRLALLRPLYLPNHVIPGYDPALYWSPPSLFLRSRSSGVPVPVVRMDLSPYRSALRGQVGARIHVREFIVVYTAPGAPAVAMPPGTPQDPLVVAGDRARDEVEAFLTEGEGSVHYVDHSAAARAVRGLEYRLMHGINRE